MEELQENPERICTFLNGHGDITIEWSKEDDSKMKDLISKKLQEGYTFFVIKPILLGLGKRKSRVKNIADVDKKSITILDEDIQTFIREANNVNLLGAQGDKQYEVVGVAKTAAEVSSNQTVATKPVRGG